MLHRSLGPPDERNNAKAIRTSKSESDCGQGSVIRSVLAADICFVTIRCSSAAVRKGTKNVEATSRGGGTDSRYDRRNHRALAMGIPGPRAIGTLCRARRLVVRQRHDRNVQWRTGTHPLPGLVCGEL